MFLVTLNTLKEFDVYGELLGMHKKNPIPHPQKHIEKQRVKTFNASVKKSDMSISNTKTVGYTAQLLHNEVPC